VPETILMRQPVEQASVLSCNAVIKLNPRTLRSSEKMSGPIEGCPAICPLHDSDDSDSVQRAIDELVAHDDKGSV